MANSNFVVHNGLTVGELTIFAANGGISTTGAISTTGGFGGVDATKIISGTSEVQVYENTTIGVTVAGSSNVALFNTGGVTLTGDIAVNGGDLTTTAGTFNLLNSTATTVNFAGAGTDVQIGAATGTTNVNNALDVDLDLNVDGGDITTNATTFNLLNTTATTLNIGAAATSMQIGSTSATAVVNFNGTKDSTTPTSGAVVIDGGLAVAKNLHVGENLHISGNLEVNGTSTTFNSNNITFTDSLILLADGNTGDVLDEGIVTARTNGGTYTHGGFVRDASDGEWKLFEGVTDEPTTTVNFAQASYANLTLNKLTATSISGALTGTASLATSVTVTANNATNETVYLAFVDGATGTQGIETDTGLSYNPSTNVLSTTATNARYADLAEMYSADAEIEPGTVVHFGGEAEVSTCDTDHCTRVAGVVSTNPAHLMNTELVAEHKIELALTGRVPCKVTGTVAKGDMMVSAGNGRARAEANPKVGAVIGKALEASEGEAVIEVVVGKH